MELMQVEIVQDRGTAWDIVDGTYRTGMAMGVEERIGGPFYKITVYTPSSNTLTSCSWLK